MVFSKYKLLMPFAEMSADGIYLCRHEGPARRDVYVIKFLLDPKQAPSVLEPFERLVLDGTQAWR